VLQGFSFLAGMSNRKVVLYTSMSLDGFLATPDDGLEWLNRVQVPGEDYGYHAFLDRVDTYIVGRRTYEVVKSLTGGTFPHAHTLDCYVLSRQPREPEEGVKFYSGSLEELIAGLKRLPGKDIYCDGGGGAVRSLLEKDLIDEFIVSIIPMLLGEGKRLFLGGVPGGDLERLQCQKYDSGLVQLHYARRRP
jgi:dihydrofolate reductase